MAGEIGIGAITAYLRLDMRNFEAGVARSVALGRDMASGLARNMEGVGTAAGVASRSFVAMGENAAVMADAVTAAAAAMTRDMTVLADGSARAGAALTEMGAAARTSAAGVTEGAAAAAGATGDFADAADRRAGKVKRALGTVSNALVVGGGTVVGAYGMMAKAAAEFDTSQLELKHNTGMTTVQLTTTSEAIKRLASESGASMKGLTAGFMSAVDLGFKPGAEALGVVTAGMKSAVSTGADVGKTITLLASVLKEFKIPASEAGYAMDVMHIAAQRGKVTVEQFVEGGGQMLSMAAGMHVSLQDVAAAFDALTQHGQTAAQAAVEVKNMLSKIIAPSKGARDEIALLSKTTGVDLVHDFSQAGLAEKGLYGVTQDVIKATRGHTEELHKLFPEMRSFMGALLLAGNAADDYTDRFRILNDVTATTRKSDSDYAETLASTSQQQKIAEERVHTLAIELGGRLLPVANRVIQAVSSWVDGFDHLSQSTRAAWEVVAGAGGAIALTAGLAVKAIIGVTELTTAWGVLTGTAGGAATATSAAGVAATTSAEATASAAAVIETSTAEAAGDVAENMSAIETSMGTMATAAAADSTAAGGSMLALAAAGGPIAILTGAVAGLAVAWETDFGHIREVTYHTLDNIGQYLQNFSEEIRNNSILNFLTGDGNDQDRGAPSLLDRLSHALNSHHGQEAGAPPYNNTLIDNQYNAQYLLTRAATQVKDALGTLQNKCGYVVDAMVDLRDHTYGFSVEMARANKALQIRPDAKGNYPNGTIVHLRGAGAGGAGHWGMIEQGPNGAFLAEDMTTDRNGRYGPGIANLSRHINPGDALYSRIDAAFMANARAARQWNDSVTGGAGTGMPFVVPYTGGDAGAAVDPKAAAAAAKKWQRHLDAIAENTKQASDQLYRLGHDDYQVRIHQAFEQAAEELKGGVPRVIRAAILAATLKDIHRDRSQAIIATLADGPHGQYGSTPSGPGMAGLSGVGPGLFAPVNALGIPTPYGEQPFRPLPALPGGSGAPGQAGIVFGGRNSASGPVGGDYGIASGYETAQRAMKAAGDSVAQQFGRGGIFMTMMEACFGPDGTSGNFGDILTGAFGQGGRGGLFGTMVDTITGRLAGAMTGQKGGGSITQQLGKELQSTMAGVLQASIKSALQQGLSALLREIQVMTMAHAANTTVTAANTVATTMNTAATQSSGGGGGGLGALLGLKGPWGALAGIGIPLLGGLIGGAMSGGSSGQNTAGPSFAGGSMTPIAIHFNGPVHMQSRDQVEEISQQVAWHITQQMQTRT